jgi:hypothetical protein
VAYFNPRQRLNRWLILLGPAISGKGDSGSPLADATLRAHPSSLVRAAPASAPSQPARKTAVRDISIRGGVKQQPSATALCSKEKITKLAEQLDAESATRLFAEGALRSARQERSARRQEGHDVAAESPSAGTESADSNVTWLRR